MEADQLQPEICTSPREPALRFTLFILQTELLIGSSSRLTPTARGSPQNQPQDVRRVALEQCYLEKRKKKKKVEKWEGRKSWEG